MFEQYMNFGGADDGSPVPMPQAPADLIGLICLVLGVLVGLLTALAIAIYMRLSGSTMRSAGPHRRPGHAPAAATVHTPCSAQGPQISDTATPRQAPRTRVTYP